MQGAADFETFYRRNKNVDTAVRQINFFDYARSRPDLIQIFCGRAFFVIFKHDDSDTAVARIRLFDKFCIVRRIYHKRRKHTGKNGASLKRHNRQLIRQKLFGRNYFRRTVFISFIRFAGFFRLHSCFRFTVGGKSIIFYTVYYAINCFDNRRNFVIKFVFSHIQNISTVQLLDKSTGFCNFFITDKL